MTGDPRPLSRHAFRAMGTDVSVLSAGDVPERAFRRAAERAEVIFAREDRRFSRFRGDSELSRVNASSGGWTQVTPPFAEVVGVALAAAVETDGLFDPSTLGAVVAAGYDRDFDEVIAGARGRLRAPVPCGRWREIELDGDMLRLPEGVGLDLGGIAKGWTVDRAAETAADDLSWAMANAGGDLRLVGETPAGGIEIAVEDPEDRSAEATRITLDTGALATSCVTKRAWGPRLHHLIDPRTGLPADTSVLQATAWAETCARAEIRSKQALLDGPAVLVHYPAVLVLAGGDVLMNMGRRTPQEVTV